MNGKKRLQTRAFAALAVIAATLAPAAPAAAQTGVCGGQAATPGVTSTFDRSANVNRITGTSGPDVIVGTASRDIIRGLQGDDIICGLDGNDLIYAGHGADRIYSGAGADTVFGGNGPDTVYAGAGSDTIHGEAHNDTIFGGNGNDKLNGNIGHDTINGSNGHDVIMGHYGRDTLNGNQGRDNINGGGLDDLINGGPDADTITGNVGTDTCINREAVDNIRNCERHSVTTSPAPSPSGPTPTQTLSIPDVACTQRALVDHYNTQIGTQATSLANAEQRLFDLINETRAICGLDPLTADSAADVQAEAHSRDMLNDKNSGHPNGQSFDQLANAGSAEAWWWFSHSTRWRTLVGQGNRVTAGENIAAAYPTLDPVVIHRNLLASGGHLCNVVSPAFDGIGLGFDYFDSSSNRGQIVTEIFTGDRNVEATSGNFIVRGNVDDPNSGTQNCWD